MEEVLLKTIIKRFEINTERRNTLSVYASFIIGNLEHLNNTTMLTIPSTAEIDQKMDELIELVRLEANKSIIQPKAIIYPKGEK